ncbi:hypothetical protein CBS101457_004783 [Exobasidium rhododendri]|nr:hypothetical protein CBS101457_004783 [Exobasidium rhododendri]
MASSFKIKLKLPPNPNPSAIASSSYNNSPQRSSAPAEGDSSVADGGSSAMSDEEGEEYDELEDSPPPNDGTPDLSNAESPSNIAKVKSIARKVSSTGSSSSTMKKASTSRNSIPMGLTKPIDQMTIEEIEALPAAKRRKSLKARGAAGPGRGWRKGLKMDQKPVYVRPGESPPRKLAPSTPSTFASSRPKSSLARDALSKTSTPLRSESPYSRESPMAIDDILLEAGETKPRKTEEEKRTTTLTSNATSATAPTAASTFTRVLTRSNQPVLPLAKIPIGFVAVAALDKSGSKKPVRSWQRQTREVVSLTGKCWSAFTWMTSKESQDQVEKERSAQKNSIIPSLEADTAPSTPGEELHHHLHQEVHGETTEVRPSPLSASTTSLPPPKHPLSSPEVDWRGSSAAFSAANKRKV